MYAKKCCCFFFWRDGQGHTCYSTTELWPLVERVFFFLIFFFFLFLVSFFFIRAAHLSYSFVSSAQKHAPVCFWGGPYFVAVILHNYYYYYCLNRNFLSKIPPPFDHCAIINIRLSISHLVVIYKYLFFMIFYFFLHCQSDKKSLFHYGADACVACPSMLHSRTDIITIFVHNVKL